MTSAAFLTARVSVAALLAASVVAGADAARTTHDWPRLWGTAGDGVSSARLSLGPSPSARELWRRKVGSGFSGIAVSGAQGFSAWSDGTDDHAVAFDLATGAERWRARLGATYRGHDGSRDGPISTPTVDEGRVFIIGPHGNLLAFDAASGRVLWRHDLKGEYGAPDPVYGFGTSPLVVGARLIVQAGGATHHLVAFDKTTGALSWASAHAKGTGYSSPVLANVAGRPQVLVASGELLFGVRPEDGALLWSQPSGATGELDRQALGFAADRVLLQHWQESRLFEVRPADDGVRAAELWKSARLRSSYSPTLFHDGHLFGFGGAYLMCVDPDDASVVWREKVYAGSAILVDGHLLILGEQSGELRVAQVSRAGYRERLKVPVFNAGAVSTTTPTFANGRVFLRNVEEMVALELR